MAAGDTSDEEGVQRRVEGGVIVLEERLGSIRIETQGGCRIRLAESGIALKAP